MDEPRKRALLALARATMQAHLSGRALPDVPPAQAELFGGVFVTLHRKDMLRGCIGRFGGEGALDLMVREMAVAVLSDPRFQSSPVTLAELPQLSIEISVLTLMTRTDDPLSLVVGKHGVLIRQGPHSGCFLPQVAIEQGWSAEQLLSYCCTAKAHLPAAAWRDPQTSVYLFEAEVLHESPSI